MKILFHHLPIRSSISNWAGNRLATIACSALILRCLKENLYPSWDAQNMNSVRLAEKLGYEFAHEYVAYEVDRTRRVH
ncbi:MAG: GNAT family N-acetyltransferase [Lachnospiraceae bacterium]|nr:GNAT family N-acetyltransferase [Lachnospiraceae bacterium]